ncbi:MAG: transcriptional repressor LexA [Pseudomonadota bacterium]
MQTDRHREVYDFLGAYIARHGHAPKLREIADHLGIRSRGVVHRYLSALRDEGLIAVEPFVSRGVRLRGRGRAAAKTATLPLLGRIAAGQPIEAIPGEDEIDLSEFFVNANRFVLRVQGDSMIEDGILDGDMVVVEKRDTADNGEIVVALIDGQEATLKRLQKNRDDSVTLKPANARLSPLRLSAARVRIQGVVVGQFRSYR